MLVKLVLFKIIEPQRSIGGFIGGGGIEDWGGGGVDYDIEPCHFFSYVFFTEPST